MQEGLEFRMVILDFFYVRVSKINAKHFCKENRINRQGGNPPLILSTPETCSQNYISHSCELQWFMVKTPSREMWEENKEAQKGWRENVCICAVEKAGT